MGELSHGDCHRGTETQRFEMMRDNIDAVRSSTQKWDRSGQNGTSDYLFDQTHSGAVLGSSGEPDLQGSFAFAAGILHNNFELKGKETVRFDSQIIVAFFYPLTENVPSVQSVS
jgi:hypothetical protein